MAPTAAQPVSPAPTFVAHSSTEAPVTGRVGTIAAGWVVSLTDPPREIPAGELVSLRQADRPLPGWPRDSQIVLANGDRVAGTLLGGDGQTLRFLPNPRVGWSGGEWSVPLTALAAGWLTPPPPDTPPDPGAYPWAGGPRRRDAVLMRNGDVIRGTIEGFAAGPAAVRIKATGDPSAMLLPITRIAAVAFDPALARVRKPRGSFARLVTTDGSRLSLQNATSDGQTLSGTSLFGGTVQLPLAEVVALDILQGKATYLSDLKPKTATVEGFNAVTWPWVADRSVKGAPLRLGSHTFDKGLGTHPRTTLIYDLRAKYRRFEALVGLDPVTGRQGAASIRILVDGREADLPALRSLTAAHSPQALSLEVRGARELTLIIDFGPGGDVQDDVNWGDARLVE